MQYFGNFLGITLYNQKNKRQSLLFLYCVYFFCFSLLYCSASASEDGEALLERSVERLASLQTIECNLRMDVWVDDVEFSARGRYEEQIVKQAAPNDFLHSMYRLDVNFLSDTPLVPGSDPNRMTIVCHISQDRAKSQIWQYRSIEGKKDLSIIRLENLENAIKRSKNKLQFGSVGEIRNLGGICAVMRQIERFYEFDKSAQSTVLDGTTVWKLTGSLRPEHYEELLKRFGGLRKRKRMPNGFPSDIELWIGKDDLFPYRIQYFGRPTEESKKRLPIVQTSYFDVILNGEEIDPANFALFNENGEYPEGVFNFRDDTNRFIQSLGL